MGKFIAFITIGLLLICCTGESENNYLEEGIKEVNGTSLYYKVMGKGEPILFVHGGPGLSHDYFLPHVSELAKEYQLIFYDQRAGGRSSRNIDSNSVTLDNFTKDIDELRIELEVKKINIVAHSWGGLVGMKYALSYPQSVNSLILLNSIGASSELRALNNQKLAERFTEDDSIRRAEILQSESFSKREPSAIEALMKIGFRHQFYDKNYLDSLELAIGEDFGQTNQLLQNFGKELTSYDYHSEFEDISSRVLLLYGDYDPLTELAAPKLRQTISDSQLRIISDCGHFPFIEKREAFVREVTRFISESK